MISEGSPTLPPCIVSKHRDRGYRAGTSPNWVKVKNPVHPAMKRVKEAFR
jgi:bifunctional non-homologous end joining protein LigD